MNMCIATSDDGINFEKYAGNPVIDSKKLPANSLVADFRDPKVWEKDGKVYMIVSVKNQDDGFSRLLLYRTEDMIDWTYNGVVFKNNMNYGHTLGRMLECPDLFSLGGYDVVIASPQTTTNHRNADSNVYIAGNLNYSTGALENWEYGDVKEIDNGFDFYAPQTMEMPDGRRVMVAWMATWNRTPVNAHLGHGYAGAMTFPRVLTMEGKRLYQNPVKEIENYYTDSYSNTVVPQNGTMYIDELGGTVQDITIEFDKSSGKTGISVFDDKEGSSLKVYYEDGRVYLDRTGATVGYYNNKPEYKITSAEIPAQSTKIKIRLLLDKYSCEVFVNDGYSAMTATVTPSAKQVHGGVFSDSGSQIKITKNNITVA